MRWGGGGGPGGRQGEKEFMEKNYFTWPTKIGVPSKNS